jgi:hypothetical protein
MNVRRYIIDYRRLVTQRIPFIMRWDDVISFLMILASPFVKGYNNLLAYRDLLIYQLTITPQVVYLEKMLNDRYDTALRRIYIEDGKQYNPLFVFRKLELKPVYLFRKSETLKPKRYVYVIGEAGQQSFDFVVYVPLGMTYNEIELKALVNNYKLASKIFTIQTA